MRDPGRSLPRARGNLPVTRPEEGTRLERSSRKAALPLARLVTPALLAFGLLLASAPAHADTAFCACVREAFGRWDTDHDGRLSPEEIESSLRDPRVEGDEAAALAVVKHYSRPDRGRPAVVWSREVLDAYESDRRARRPRNPYQGRFERYQKLLQVASHKVFAQGTPRRAAIHQQSGGDCFFLAVVGAMLERDAQEVVRLLEPREDGGAVVRFPHAPPIMVGPPTEAERAAYTDDSDDGTWLYCLQRAYGVLRKVREPRFAAVVDPIDAVDSGGQTTAIIETLAGHTAESVAIGPDGDAGKAETLRAWLARAVSQRRLATLHTATAAQQRAMPSRLPTSHAMAVLGFDAATDLVTVWNPWGNDDDPKGSAPRAGYRTRGGVFAIPAAEVVRWFRKLTVEAAP